MGIKEARDYLSEAYDPDELVDILGITSEELVSAFPEKVLHYSETEFLDHEESLREED